ncbi:PRD domain-containing protein [Amedibacillus dolichus]|uniref:PRD domain-containing protein n=1 Tax=Amedibacillus dolichus TaxID=31971 RepID=A0ABT7U9W7_9FIRM|nr:PRD domain-containing protein [Amedibacillus dolichus]MDM8156425.1 PRD domain-containing protein [Amedibacillus dolichus]
MKIHKILNNNVVVVMDAECEKVVMGRGLAFSARVGDEVRKDRIQKEFILSSQPDVNRTLQMLASIPIDYLQLADQILTKAQEELHLDGDALFLSLSDHIRGVVERARDGVLLNNPLLPEIRRFYAREFALGMRAVAAINQQFHVTLNEDEAAFIAMHLLISKDGCGGELLYQQTEMIAQIANEVAVFSQQTYDESSMNYYRFISHLRLLTQRLLAGKKDGEDWDDSLLQVVRQKYRSAYQCAVHIRKFVYQRFGQELTWEELLYLTIHIHRLNNSN